MLRAQRAERAAVAINNNKQRYISFRFVVRVSMCRCGVVPLCVRLCVVRNRGSRIALFEMR